METTITSPSRPYRFRVPPSTLTTRATRAPELSEIVMMLRG